MDKMVRFKLFFWHVGVLMAVFVIPEMIYSLIPTETGGDLSDPLLYQRFIVAIALIILAFLVSYESGGILSIISLMAFLSAELVSRKDISGGTKFIIFVCFYIIIAVIAAVIKEQLRTDSEKPIGAVYLHFLTILITLKFIQFSPLVALVCFLIGVVFIGMVLLKPDRKPVAVKYS